MSKLQAGHTLWDGIEGAAWRSISDALDPITFLADAFDAKQQELEHFCGLLEPEEQARFRKEWEQAPFYSAWRDLTGETMRLHGILEGLLAITSLPSGHPARPRYFASGPAFLRTREALSSYFEIVLQRFDAAQLSLKRLDAAALAVEREEAVPGPFGSVVRAHSVRAV